ncbi:hypothetical protein [Methanosarcina horonobensis]|uniref:hypothetical protein n=1 Tax=Methanosarcina horonobensis TaxID=418008 RepID=UPI000A87F3F0|nr:hypothetical protein [Methanosarcina horonobensis]
MPECRYPRIALVYMLPVALLIGSLFVGRYQTPVSAVVDESMKAFSSLFLALLLRFPLNIPYCSM